MTTGPTTCLHYKVEAAVILGSCMYCNKNELNISHHTMKNTEEQKQSVPNERTTPRHHYQIRFNTKHGASDLVWRIFEDNIECLATAFRISTHMYSEQSTEDGVTKWNVACDGQMRIDEHGTAHIW